MIGCACGSGRSMPQCGSRHRIGAMHASSSENSPLRKYGLTLKRSAPCSTVSRSSLRRAACSRASPPAASIASASGIPVALDANSARRTCARDTGIHGHQRRMRKALVEVFHDDARVVEHEVAVHQRRHAVVGIEVEQVLGQTPGHHVDDLDRECPSPRGRCACDGSRIERLGEQRHHVRDPLTTLNATRGVSTQRAAAMLRPACVT
jgi:hypothetical protein